MAFSSRVLVRLLAAFVGVFLLVQMMVHKRVTQPDIEPRPSVRSSHAGPGLGPVSADSGEATNTLQVRLANASQALRQQPVPLQQVPARLGPVPPPAPQSPVSDANAEPDLSLLSVPAVLLAAGKRDAAGRRRQRQSAPLVSLDTSITPPAEPLQNRAPATENDPPYPSIPADTVSRAWPGLASNAPWPVQAPKDCDGYFGNGFVMPFSLLPAFVGGRMQCFYHPALTTHICDMDHVSVDPRLIDMVDGGELLDSVPARREREEHPNCRPGAFTIAVATPTTPFPSSLLPFPQKLRGYTHDLQLSAYTSMVPVLSSASPAVAAGAGAPPVMAGDVPVPVQECSNWVTTPTVFVTRFEYHNLFHTSTDWYNVYQAARSLGLGKVSIVYLDGHTQSPMDEVWKALGHNVTFVKQLQPHTCFSRVVFVPFGWHASVSLAISPTKQCPTNVRVREFSDVIVRSFGLTPGPPTVCSADSTTVLFVRRVDYKAHPRHTGKLELRIANEDAILIALQEWASRGTGRVVLDGQFHVMTVRQQIQMAQQACIILAAHGAGLSHVLFARPRTQVLELRPPRYLRPHFIGYSKWAGAGYTHWDTGTASPDPQKVVDLVQELSEHPKDA